MRSDWPPRVHRNLRPVMQSYPPIDQQGRALEIGDWVRVVAVPPEVDGAPPKTQAAFARALGLTFRVESFNPFGLVELDLTNKVAWGESIWVEPPYLRRTRRRRTVTARPSGRVTR